MSSESGLWAAFSFKGGLRAALLFKCHAEWRNSFRSELNVSPVVVAVDSIQTKGALDIPKGIVHCDHDGRNHVGESIKVGTPA